MTRRELHAIKDQGRWGAHAKLLLSEPDLTPQFKDEFGTFWIEAGHHIREQIGDDQTLVRLLRHLLPAYEGEGLALFRGENRSRWEGGLVGLAWTSKIATARMFGSGLNAVRSGGVLLKAFVEPESIISGPNAHSNYLDEGQFTVDPFRLSSISATEFFPAGR